MLLENLGACVATHVNNRRSRTIPLRGHFTLGKHVLADSMPLLLSFHSFPFWSPPLLLHFHSLPFLSPPSADVSSHPIPSPFLPQFNLLPRRLFKRHFIPLVILQLWVACQGSKVEVKAKKKTGIHATNQPETPSPATTCLPLLHHTRSLYSFSSASHVTEMQQEDAEEERERWMVYGDKKIRDKAI